MWKGEITPEERMVRILDLMNKQGIENYAQLARLAGMQRTSMLSSLQTGRFTLQFLVRLSEVLNCRAGHLVDRKGHA